MFIKVHISAIFSDYTKAGQEVNIRASDIHAFHTANSGVGWADGPHRPHTMLYTSIGKLYIKETTDEIEKMLADHSDTTQSNRTP